MALIILTILILGYLYIKYPNIFDMKQHYIVGRYIRLDKETNTTPINYSNFIIYDNEFKIINPVELSVFPSIVNGNGIYPRSIDIYDLNDIILVETNTSSTDPPYVEYDLGKLKKISNVTIINRKQTVVNEKYKVNERLNNTILRILNEDRNQIFEYKISDIRSIYSINIE